jgi:hypothetical protein
LFELNINRSCVQKVEEILLSTSPLPENLFDEIKTSVEFVMGDTLMRFSYGREYQDYLIKQRSGSLPLTSTEKKSNNFLLNIKRGSVTDAVGEFFTGKRKGGSPGTKVMLTEDQIKKKIQKQRIMEEEKLTPASPDTPKRNSIWTFGKNSKKEGLLTDRRNSIVELFAPLSNRKRETPTTPTTPDVTKTLLSSRSEKKKETQLTSSKNIKGTQTVSEKAIDEVTPIQFESNLSWKFGESSPKVVGTAVSSHENSETEEEPKKEKVPRIPRKSTSRKTRERPVYGEFNSEFKMEEVPLTEFKMEEKPLSEFKMDETPLTEFKMEETPETLLEFKLKQEEEPHKSLKEKRKTNRKPREETSTSFDSFSFGSEQQEVVKKEEEKLERGGRRSSSRRTNEKPVYGEFNSEFKLEEEFKIPEEKEVNFPNEKRKTNRKTREAPPPITLDSFSLNESTKQDQESPSIRKFNLSLNLENETKSTEERRNQVLSPRKPREYLNSNFSFENLEKEMKDPNSNLDLLLKKRKSKNEQVLEQSKRKGKQEQNSFSDEKETVNQ